MAMNHLVTSSRGVGLHALIKDEVREWGGLSTEIISGGTFSKISNYVVKELLPSLRKPNPPHIYIMAGIPDITTLKKGGNLFHPYRECILDGTESSVTNSVLANIEQCSHDIRDAGAIPIFCTVSNMNISKYNNYLLEHNRTHTLHHSQDYDTMQHSLDNIMQAVNEHIVTHNKTHNMATPHCHSAIRKHRGKAGAGYYFYDYRLFSDGLHADKDPKNKEGKIVRKLWAKSIRAAIIKNYDLHCDDDDCAPPSPRPWRGEKRKAPQE